MKAVAGDRELRACLSTAHVLRIDCCAGAEERTLLCIDAKPSSFADPLSQCRSTVSWLWLGPPPPSTDAQVTRGTEPLEHTRDGPR
jgi:hypothetical protein